jgi:hypothetical protein
VSDQRCPRPDAHADDLAQRAYNELPVGLLGYLAAHDLDKARETVAELATELQELVTSWETAPPQLERFDPCDHPRHGDRFYVGR